MSEKIDNSVKGVGIDIVPIEMVRKIVDRYQDELSYLYSENEVSSCSKHAHDSTNFGICFSGKEAVAKALGTGLGIINWNEIEINSNGLDIGVTLHGAALARANSLGISCWEGSWVILNDLICTVIIAK